MLSRLAGMVGAWLLVGAFAAAATGQGLAVTAESGPNRFTNNDLTVTQGQSVTFSNGGGTHNVHFDDGTVDNPATADASAWSFSHQFDQVGDFRYYCELHGGAGGVGMSGIVHVVAAPANPPPGGGPPQQEPGGGSPNPGPGGPAPGGQSPAAELKVTLKLSDATPLAGRVVRLSGVVRPARDGRKLQIQKRLPGGRFKTIASTRLHAAPGDRSTYAIKLRLSKDVVLRARVADAASKARKLDVHRAA